MAASFTQVKLPEKLQNQNMNKLPHTLINQIQAVMFLQFEFNNTEKAQRSLRSSAWYVIPLR